jgi:Zn finger protein HypA/HybF involved in hydrogenase expression
MHELGIASSILEAVRTEMAPYPEARAVKVTVRIGAMSGVDPNSLAFCYQALVSGTEFEPLVLALEPAAADELELSSLELEKPS